MAGGNNWQCRLFTTNKEQCRDNRKAKSVISSLQIVVYTSRCHPDFDLLTMSSLIRSESDLWQES